MSNDAVLGRRVMTADVSGLEVRALALAAVAWIAADLGPSAFGHPTVAAVAAVLVVVGFRRRTFVPLACGVFCLLAFLGASATAAYRPLTAGPVDAVVTVVGDPEPVGLGWRVDVRLPDGRRAEAVAFGPTGWDLSTVSVGQTHHLVGVGGPPGAGDWYRVRHIAGRVSVKELRPVAAAGPVWAVTETVRSIIVAGGATMSDRHRALYLGLVIGDDRFQPFGQQLNFRNAGLTHLLAVSGQNVAFVLAVARGPLQLLGRRQRLAVSVAVLVVFALVTRMEPSVMRATAAALLAVWTAATGRQRSGLVILSLAVIGVLCVDPFLADSVGFQLSVAASLGILLLVPLIQRRLPGPTWFAAPAATTLAAQIGVAPVLTAYFGPISIVSVPANLAAGWAAAAVMTLGLTVGIVAGIAPEPIAAAVQTPTVLLLRWLDWVAAVAGRSNLPRLGPLALTMVVAALVMAGPHQPGSVGSRPRVPMRRVVGCGLAFVLLVSAWPPTPRHPLRCGPGMSWYPAAGSEPAEIASRPTAEPGARSVLVIEPEAARRTLVSCLDHGIRDADVVVAVRGDRRTAELVSAVGEVMRTGTVVAPPQHRIVGATRLQEPLDLRAGDVRVTVVPASDDRLVVDVIPVGS
ncbi:MAG: ComEC/Rec2 family competence protein [Actinomycetota bacterium]